MNNLKIFKVPEWSNLIKEKLFIFSFMILWAFLFVNLSGQQVVSKPDIKNRQRTDLRDLGYPQVNEIPFNCSSITSLMTGSDGIIYGGTSGENAYLFLFDPKINKIRHLGKIPSQNGIYHSLIEDKEGNIYIGTSKNMFEEVQLSKWGEGENNLDITLWKDIKTHYSKYPGGHLFRYKPALSNEKVKPADNECEVEDLGMPLANNSIYALTINPKGDEIYGLTYPDGHLFIYNILLFQNPFRFIK